MTKCISLSSLRKIISFTHLVLHVCHVLITYYHPHFYMQETFFLLHIILLCTKTPQTRGERFSSKNQVSIGLVRKVLKQDDYINIQHLLPTTLLHFKHFVQYTHTLCVVIINAKIHI